MVTLRCQPASNDLLRLWPISVITGCLYCPVVFLVLLSPLLSLCFRSRRIRPLRCGLFCAARPWSVPNADIARVDAGVAEGSLRCAAKEAASRGTDKLGSGGCGGCCRKRQRCWLCSLLLLSLGLEMIRAQMLRV